MQCNNLPAASVLKQAAPNAECTPHLVLELSSEMLESQNKSTNEARTFRAVSGTLSSRSAFSVVWYHSVLSSKHCGQAIGGSGSTSCLDDSDKDPPFLSSCWFGEVP
eukprot:scaffold3502_cov183-Amphora_coffeaeformis.AAC.10